MIGNKITDKITKISRRSPQNNSETVGIKIENTKFDREIPKERYISLEKKQQINIIIKK